MGRPLPEVQMDHAGATLSLKDVVKIYQMGSSKVYALHGVSLEIGQNEYVAIMGPSGSGKSTLMNMIGCLDVPTSGSYFLDGEPVSDKDEDELAKSVLYFRRSTWCRARPFTTTWSCPWFMAGSAGQSVDG
jgi:predicted ABC-type transport system involved in lysophospholipase L1 biosynthesis ATPase subunit